uniref:DUF4372 domain-containing protein n=1 Tax=Schistosoma curassoni TaxID=6186 RepID=A0A183KNU4_9TREM
MKITDSRKKKNLRKLDGFALSRIKISLIRFVILLGNCLSHKLGRFTKSDIVNVESRCDDLLIWFEFIKQHVVCQRNFK